MPFPGNPLAAFFRDFIGSNDKVNFETFDLGETLQAYLAAAENPLKSLALHQGTTVTIDKHIGANAMVHGNRADITLIAQVLIKNSIDALVQDGQIGIDVRRAGDSVHLQVKDTGKGMDGETRQKLFERYFTTKDPRSRTGLGLSNARRIALKHGGDIRLVHSRVGVGTTMELTLPYARQQASVEPAGHEQKEHLNILWAEDDVVIQETVKTMTRAFADHIDFAQNGNIAMDMLQRKPYDVLITDVGMPIMGGWKLLKCIAGRYDNMTRVIASGYVINSSDMNASGASYLLNKPLDKDDLVAVLETIKTGPRVSRQNTMVQSAYHR